MEINRYIIWTTSLEDTNLAAVILKEHTTVIKSISNNMFCIETKLTSNTIRDYLGYEMEMVCVVLDEIFINKLINTAFKKEEKNNFIEFLNLTKTPNTIDDILDLINERGGVECLSEREVSALDRLTNKPTQ
jgi:hypothetical protein